MRRASFIAALLFPVALFAAQPDLNEIRESMRRLDYELALRQADVYLGAHPESLEAHAWRSMAASRTGHYAEAEAEARWMTSQHPNDAWSWLAQAASPRDNDEMTAAAERMMKLAPPGEVEFARVRARSARALPRAEALNIIDSLLARFPDDARIAGAKASVLINDPATINEALTLFEKAHAADPSALAVTSDQAGALLRLKRAPEAMARAQEALQAAPYSLAILRLYWNAVHARSDMTEEAKRAAIGSTIESLLRARGNWPEAVHAVAREYREQRRVEEAGSLETYLLAAFPDSLDAEMVLHDRLVPRGETIDEKSRLAAARQYVAWPCHEPRFLASGYLALFMALSGDRSAGTDAELMEAIRGMQSEDEMNPHITYLEAAILLADRGVHLDEAERLARRGGVVMYEQLEKHRVHFDDAEYKLGRSSVAGRSHDALGWVLFAEKKTAAARRELELARDSYPDDPRIHYHLGRLDESAGNTAAAQQEYLRGMMARGFGPNPNEAALKALYARAQHSMAGYEAFLKSAREGTAPDRKAAILREKVKDARPVPPFALKALDGAVVRTDDLRGKVAVVNFWGVWCGWCVREMPEFQQLARKYAADPQVRILTVNNDADVEKVRRWMGEKKYDFSVLLDDGFVTTNGIFAFPTTWFIDPAGRIAFNKRGASQKLLEEFTWRIEALRHGK